LRTKDSHHLCHALEFILNTGSTIATTLYDPTHIYRVNTPILDTTSVQSINIPHMRTVHTPQQFINTKVHLKALMDEYTKVHNIDTTAEVPHS
jgi:hypothetical protein